MHTVILAAGEGSRLGRAGENVPKAFIEIDGRTLYDRQRSVVDAHADDVTVVLGYRYEEVLDDIDSARVVIVENWRNYDNAESLRRAILGINDDVLVLNGDLVITERAIDRVVRRYRNQHESSIVAGLPSVQSEHTAFQCDENGTVTDYGMIEGHRHAGFSIIDRSDVDTVVTHLRQNRQEWYPVAYPEIEAKLVIIPSDHHIEINQPRDKRRAQRQLPLPLNSECD